MKNKDLINLIIHSFILGINLIIIILSAFGYNNFRLILMLEFGFYTTFNLLKYILLGQKKDWDTLANWLLALIAFIASLFISLKQNLILVFLIWVALMCFIKLKKSDFYHDHHNKKWITNLIMLAIFMISGLVSGILLVTKNPSISTLGYFYIINSILEIMSSLNYKKKRLKNANHR